MDGFYIKPNNWGDPPLHRAYSGEAFKRALIYLEKGLV